MILIDELKQSGRYDYNEDENSFCSHKYKSNIIFFEDNRSLKYIIYPDSNPEGYIIFAVNSDISFEALEQMIDIMESQKFNIEKLQQIRIEEMKRRQVVTKINNEMKNKLVEEII